MAHIMLVEAESKRAVGGGLIIQNPKRLLRCQAAVRALSMVYIYTFRLFLSSSLPFMIIKSVVPAKNCRCLGIPTHCILTEVGSSHSADFLKFR